MSVIEDLNLINQYKGDIKQAIIDKGVDMTGTPLSGYAGKIGEIQGGGEEPKITVKFYEFVRGQWMVRAGRQYKVSKGASVSVPTPYTVTQSTAAGLSNPEMEFVGWDSPVDIIDDTVTVPLNWIGDMEIYANYSFDTDYYVLISNSALTAGVTTVSSPATIYALNADTLLQGNSGVRYARPNVIISDGFLMEDNQFLYNFRSLNSLVLPKSIMYIGTQHGSTKYNSTCSTCVNLVEVHLPNNLTEIGDYAFYSCIKLRKVNIPTWCERIGTDAFYGVYGLVEVILPEGLIELGSGAFRTCPMLRTVHVKAMTPPTLASNTFASSNQLSHIYVPDEAVDAYKTATNWVDLADKIFPESEYKA